MIFESIENCCETAIAIFDGVYGSYNETIAIIVFVLIFNFLAKWIINRLQLRYQNHNRIWLEGFIKAIYQPLSYYVWFFALVHAINIIAAQIQERLPAKNLHMLLAAGAVLALAWFLLRWKKNVTQSMIAKSKNREIHIDQGKIAAIDKILTVSIGFFTLLTLLEVTDRSVNTLIAFSSVGGLALAFASQEIIANFFGGAMIYLNQPFTVGDWIHIPEKNIEGIVEDIGWYMTRVRSMDKRPIYIPNSIFSKIVVITPSRMSHRQIKENIPLRPEDLPQLKGIINDIKDMTQHHPEIDRNQTILVNLASLSSSSLDINLSMFTAISDTTNFMRIKEDILFKISAILLKHNAKIVSGGFSPIILSTNMRKEIDQNHQDIGQEDPPENQEISQEISDKDQGTQDQDIP
jgi:MscS family membrane protein